VQDEKNKAEQYVAPHLFVRSAALISEANPHDDEPIYPDNV
jgi:hypothetical protein